MPADNNQDEPVNPLPNDFYKRKCSSLINQLAELNNQLIDKPVTALDEAELSVRIEFVDRVYNDFDKVHSQLEEIDISEFDSNTRSDFFSVYFELKAKLSRGLYLQRKDNFQHSSTRRFTLEDAQSTLVIQSPRKSRLPELNIPKFSGEYIDWPNFFAMFQSVVDNNNDLSKVEKLQHLRTSLQGAALNTISSLEPNEENYDKALTLLKDRFDNKLLIFQEHIKSMFALKVVEKGSAKSLRELSDKFNSHLRALQTMATPEQISDGLLIYLVVHKLDQRTQEKWEENLPTQKLPAWIAMSSFLEKRCRMMENLDSALVTQTPSKQVGKQLNFAKSTRNVLVASANGHILCVFCNSKEHYVNSCPIFINLSPNLRFKEVKRLQLCINCLRKGHNVHRCKSSHCRHCPAKHNTLLHMSPISSSATSLSNFSASETNNEVIGASSSAPKSALISSSLINLSNTAPKPTTNNYVLLATAVLFIKNGSGSYVPCRAILDSASQLNFITTRLANLLQLPSQKSQISISGIGESNFIANKSIDIFARSQDGEYTTSFTAVVTPNITDYQPNFNLKTSDWNIPENIKLADPQFFKPQRIDILIGAGLFFDLMCVGQIHIAKNQPILQKTRLGWVISGSVSYSSNKSSTLVAFSKNVEDQVDDFSLNDLVKRFWEVENCFASTCLLSEDELRCEQHFQQNFTRLASGAYSVKLPVKIDLDALGDSFNNALRRFKSLERKLQNNLELKMQYTSFMNEYASLGHMSIAKSQMNTPKYFLPHHCVQKLDSTTTKLRVVFDASAKTTSGKSLNDLLLAGPTIQQKLFNILLRFRFFKVALCGDICKMYRCVQVSHPDEYLQCILWRDSPKDDITIYTLDTVTYGTKPAAFLAIRSMHQLAIDEGHDFPLGAIIVRRDFYVDDLISGGETIEEVVEIRQQVKDLLQRGNFQIRKWSSNEADVLLEVPDSDREKLLKFHDGTDVTKTLGLAWDPNTDNFLFSFTPIINKDHITKRSVLATIARCYDPLGLISPIITKAKIFLQTLWKEKLHWDESLPQSLQTLWIDMCTQFTIASSFKFPRFVLIPKATWELHAFCDASLEAFGACVYVRSENQGYIESTLLCAKSKVAPLKTLTVPKLELSAALLLAELVASILQSVQLPRTVHCWSDSMVTLSWLREQPSNFNIFVSNRVSQIQNLTNNMTWHHVPTSLNPADIISRGCTPNELLHSQLWKQGPPFLLEHPSNWPETMEFLNDLPERRRKVLLVSSSPQDLSLNCKFHNSFERLQRVFAYIYHFRQYKTRSDIPLTPKNIKMGTHMLIRSIQESHFAVELQTLRCKKQLNASNPLYSLNPFIDLEGILRVGGRLQNSFLDFEAKHPILLPKHHPVTNAIIDYFHRRNLHAGPQSLLASIRQQYWPIGGRKTVASIINKCIRCFRLKPKIFEHIMGNLPADRVQANRVFLTTGTDFCGPFYYKSEVRNRPPIKCYICIFVCFSTKASHLELVKDLSTPAFLAALKRFICTRGRPQTIWSDNATNFVGARNELAELKQLFCSEAHNLSVSKQCLEDGILWKFIPPRSPHFGGLWEAAVKAAKLHFYRTVGLSILSFEELRTLVCEISAIINSRPLCPISENPADLEVLTPAHFLVGAPLTAIIEPDVTHLNINHLDRWQRVTYMQQLFWKKWSSSYLSLLQERKKWRTSTSSICVGSMVLVKDDNLPPLKWQLGRVDSTICGNDGVPRVVIVRTSNGLIKRAVRKIAVLPVENHEVESPRLPTGGECCGSTELI